MEEHDVEGGGAAGEDWKMKKTTKVVVVRRRRLVVISQSSFKDGWMEAQVTVKNQYEHSHHWSNFRKVLMDEVALISLLNVSTGKFRKVLMDEVALISLLNVSTGVTGNYCKNIRNE
ncbi:hypothetical protein YC2023_041698 [Brassica napus]